MCEGLTGELNKEKKAHAKSRDQLESHKAKLDKELTALKAQLQLTEDDKQGLEEQLKNNEEHLTAKQEEITALKAKLHQVENDKHEELKTNVGKGAQLDNEALKKAVKAQDDVLKLREKIEDIERSHADEIEQLTETNQRKRQDEIDELTRHVQEEHRRQMSKAESRTCSQLKEAHSQEIVELCKQLKSQYEEELKLIKEKKVQEGDIVRKDVVIHAPGAEEKIIQQAEKERAKDAPIPTEQNQLKANFEAKLHSELDEVYKHKLDTRLKEAVEGKIQEQNIAWKDRLQELEEEIDQLKCEHKQQMNAVARKHQEVVSKPKANLVLSPKENVSEDQNTVTFTTNSSLHIKRCTLVVYGIKECDKGTPRQERVVNDSKQVYETLEAVHGNLPAEHAIQECVRLGQYKEGKSRPMLIRLVRSCDVSIILSNCSKLADFKGISIKPYMSRSEQKVEKLLLYERRKLIDSGTHRKLIKVRGNSLFVDNRKHGSVTNLKYTILKELEEPTESSSQAANC